jgi:hypothetical protein
MLAKLSLKYKKDYLIPNQQKINAKSLQKIEKKGIKTSIISS